MRYATTFNKFTVNSMDLSVTM